MIFTVFDVPLAKRSSCHWVFTWETQGDKKQSALRYSKALLSISVQMKLSMTGWMFLNNCHWEHFLEALSG